MRPAQAHGLPLLHLSDGRATLRLNRPDQHKRLQVEDRLAAPVLQDAEVQASVDLQEGKSAIATKRAPSFAGR